MVDIKHWPTIGGDCVHGYHNGQLVADHIYHTEFEITIATFSAAVIVLIAVAISITLVVGFLHCNSV